MQYLNIGSRLPNIKQHPGVIEIKGQILLVLKMRFVRSERVLTYTYSDKFFLSRKTFSLRKNTLNKFLKNGCSRTKVIIPMCI